VTRAPSLGSGDTAGGNTEGGDTDSGDTGRGDTGSGGQGADCSGIVAGASRQDDYRCAHNLVRAEAKPTPVPALPELVWDEQLAEIARAHAE
jgi:pathogenesis-related protein 1